MSETRFDKISARLGALKQKRVEHEPYWEKAEQMCSATSYIWIRRGKRTVQQLFDSTGSLALSFFISGMKSVLIPKSERWHKLRPVNPALEVDDECRTYLDWLTGFLFKARYSNNSRFNSEADGFLESIGKYGTGVFLTEDNIGFGITYKNIDLWECYLDENANGEIDTIYREYKLSAREAVKRFRDDITNEIKETANKAPEQEVTILHAIEPNPDFNPKSMSTQEKKYISFYVDITNQKIFKTGGFDYLPYSVARYKTIPQSVYGIGPAEKAMAEILTINEMNKTILSSAQRSANPTVLVSDEANVEDAGKLGTAGAIAYGMIGEDGKPLARPMEYGNNLAISLEMQSKIREIIYDHFMVRLFRTLADQKGTMTIPEVMARKTEDANILGPVADRISLEWLPGVITREIYIYNNYGLIPPVPNKLAMPNSGMTIEFESPAVRMQQSSAVEGILRTVETIAPLAQIDDAAADILDVPEAARYIAEFNSVPATMIRSKEKAAQRSAARAQAMQAGQLLAAAPVVTQSLKSLSEAKNNATV